MLWIQVGLHGHSQWGGGSRSDIWDVGMGLNIVFLTAAGFILLSLSLPPERGRPGNGTGLLMLAPASADIELPPECELYICCTPPWELWPWRTTGEAPWDGPPRELDEVTPDPLAAIPPPTPPPVGCCALANVVELLFSDVDGFVGGTLLWVLEFEGDTLSGA